ncbi:cytochrome c-550 PedF [Rhodoblastus acidophilus]|jgi:cytochrome c-550 PedF|uniref:Cytochrome c-550 PedF n=1 Tax=Candidatus Rhodoblastus alkanivorans TaxID=2954117 RepID=A0ABS9Z4I9_9HYPH|nr:cytochrome c-550 PedF [Candidatus Rhodoblastus alkanivorans]MCI4677719.1 cytochrome c-550 PedF [Candidatus Rhodoblastus alkanivorans]MCI4682549.1 cytochrome c-550 PedF [Candidatus Rhodoblastus alkanivorans]MDI4639855.1 cytochrome c-550 PedF [Rhodoblastus acidophilus]
MRKITGAAGLAAGFLLLASVEVMAHGDVTPHPVDTTGLPPLGKTWVDSNPYRGNAKAIAIGSVGYYHNCAACHGLNAEAGGMAPDLLQIAKDCVTETSAEEKASCFKDSDDYFKGVVLEGHKNSEGRVTMPSYSSVFTQEAVWAIKAYLDKRTADEAKTN